MDKQQLIDTAVQHTDELYNKKVKPVPTPEKEIGIDLEDKIIDNIVDTVETSQFDINKLNSFTNVSRSRNDLYNTLDDMSTDSTIAAVLETYAEDATETNDKGNIVWAESDDSECLKFVTYLLNALNIDKNIYQWTHSLCKYGDVYLRLYRESEYDDLLFSDNKHRRKKNKKVQSDTLNEDVNIKYYSKNDNYVHYLEMVPNPAQIFELTRFGKTAAYIKTNVESDVSLTNNTNQLGLYNLYKFQKNDVDLYTATEFVHGCLQDNTSRTPEEVELFVNEDKSIKYKVKRGQSLLYNSYKTWRQLILLENSVLLNRITQSSIVRVIGVEVGDMPKENVPAHLMNIKQLIEQKAAIEVGKSINEYTNPGPIINNVYVPTRNQQGTITTQQIGGDVKIGDLADLDYYQDKYFGSLRVPKQYFGITDDNAGFSGGQSLSIISSRYAKMIKRIQNTMIQMLTDAINLIMIDTGNESYINRFTLRMQAPTTQEEVDRRENMSNRISLIRDIMDTFSDIDNATTKLKILKSLLSSAINDPSVIELLQGEIEQLEQESINENDSSEDIDNEEDESIEPVEHSFSDDSLIDFNDTSNNDAIDISDEADTNLPSPADLDIGDVSDATNPNLD